MKVQKIYLKKKNGDIRTIYAPLRTFKTRLRLMVPDLNKRVQAECDPDVVHGFVLGRSPVTNAMMHRGFQYTLSMDIKDFFDTIKYSHIVSTSTRYDLCFIHSRKGKFISFLPQGFPTSPAISNLVMKEWDAQMKQICQPLNIVYTRYADDLSFSGNNLDDLIKLRDSIPALLMTHGFEINPDKTRIQWAGYGRRNITGINVDDTIHISRNTKRKLRAARHQKNNHTVHGLVEWSKLKPPNPNGSPRLSRVTKALVRHVARRISGIRNIWE